jgi:osmotically-inducible protein OsmY
MTNANPMLMRDQALSETDRRTLAQIRAAVFGPNQAAAPPAGTPVHFILKDGAVRLVGTVSTMEERQRIENLVQQVPGVTRVFDALQVSQQPGVQPTAQ